MVALVFLSMLVNTIIEDYFYNSRCIFIFTEDSTNFEYKNNLPVVTIQITNNVIEDDLIFRSYGCQEFIIQHTNASDIIEKLEDKMKLHTDRFNSRKYLILPTQNNPLHHLYKIFNLTTLDFITDLLVIVPDEEQTTEIACDTNFHIECSENEIYNLVTHKYVGKEDCNKPVILDRWFSKNVSFLFKHDLYPDKISNQQGRILKGATLNYKPYSITGTSSKSARGSENNVVHEYVKRHNLTLEYILDDSEWGEIYENWTGIGVLGNVAMDKADVGFGALYTWEHEINFLDFTKPLVRTGITCLVPAPRLAAGWLTPLLPFSLLMWLGTTISFIVVYFAIISITTFLIKTRIYKEVSSETTNYQKLLQEAFFRAFRLFLTQSLPETQQAIDMTFKYLFSVFLFVVLLTTCYSSGLASVMTIPRYGNTIHTVLDLANSGLHWGATQDAWIFSIMNDKRAQYQILVERFQSSTLENLEKLAEGDNFAFSIERLPSGHYAIGSYIKESSVQNLRLMKEDLYWEYCIFMLRKSSALLHSLDKFVLEMFQSGIIYFWEMKAAETHMDLRVQNIVHYYTTTTTENQEGVVKLKWIHVEGAFGLLGLGHALSTACFLLENISYKCNHRNVKKFIM